MTTVTRVLDATQTIEHCTNDLYTFGEALDVLKAVRAASVRTMMPRWVRAGLIRRVKVAGSARYRYFKSDVDALAASREPDFDTEHYYTAREVRAVLGVPRGTDVDLMKRHGVPTHTFTSPTRRGYLKSAVDALAVARQAPEVLAVTPDPDAFAQLYAATFDRGVRYISRGFGLDLAVAQDIVQDAFLNLWRAGDRFFVKFPEFTQQQRVIVHQWRCQAMIYLKAQQAQQNAYGKPTDAGIDVYEHRLHAHMPRVEQQVLAREAWQSMRLRLRSLSKLWRTVVHAQALGYTEDEISIRCREQGLISGTRVHTAQILRVVRRRLAEQGLTYTDLMEHFAPAADGKIARLGGDGDGE
ncbi:MAG: hypothetical protein H0U76_15570, partial [Ktedonobacteraceae bacterium]|nr:hypothetical protein [Ktedonobacteraceae bacterium]